MIHTNIQDSCYVMESLSNEQFIADHIFLYQQSGSLIINDADKEYILNTGDFGLLRKNCLAKCTTIPTEKGDYKTITLVLDQPFLKEFIKEFRYTEELEGIEDSVVKINSSPLLINYINSLPPYFNLEGNENQVLLSLKMKEAVLLLIKTDPNLKNILFHFGKPGKIDLEAFMNRNFQFNVPLERFSYMSGRSIATFKRDFKKVFKVSPGRWLLQKRLEQAHYLITKKGKKPSEIYLEVGFEDISHFSRSFREKFGAAPVKYLQENVEKMIKFNSRKA
ncbi:MULTISPECIES: AraC family transcriptional regulator [Chryseobacterium]|uniref:AraC-type DNA-binding protein n=1 Tax=Chryseobacterium wanjuense TaxID=356305 RepID=A0A1I0QZG5_9FLAO|nr:MULTISPECIES: AraC family transcriptional regulator [Chryseobacterium]SEW33369.1 AraC-type DNA-binding protein [Chryseobacterium wanjuense]